MGKFGTVECNVVFFGFATILYLISVSPIYFFFGDFLLFSLKFVLVSLFRESVEKSVVFCLNAKLFINAVFIALTASFICDIY